MDDISTQIEQAARLKIESLDEQIAALKVQRDRLIAELQCSCSHPRESIAEVEFAASTWCSHATPPKRVCLVCGLAEWGWSCGHKLLSMGRDEYKVNPRRITDQEFFRRIRGAIHKNETFVGCEDPRAKLRIVLGLDRSAP